MTLFFHMKLNKFHKCLIEFKNHKQTYGYISVVLFFRALYQNCFRNVTSFYGLKLNGQKLNDGQQLKATASSYSLTM